MREERLTILPPPPTLFTALRALCCSLWFRAKDALTRAVQRARAPEQRPRPPYASGDQRPTRVEVPRAP